MRTSLLILFFVFSALSAVLAKAPGERFAEIKLEDLRKAYGNNKNLPKGYELQCLIALSRYPELKDTRINFILGDLKTTMAARPQPDFIFRKKEDRIYTVLINNRAAEREGVSIVELSFAAQVGIIAHEFAHILAYSKMSRLEMILCGGCYYSSPYFHKKIERETDLITIERGFGEQLYEFSDYVLNKSSACDAYKDFKKKFYYQPEEIRQAMLKMKTIYQ